MLSIPKNVYIAVVNKYLKFREDGLILSYRLKLKIQVGKKGRKEEWKEKAETKPIIINSTGSKEGNVLFNDALNTFYLLIYGVRHMVKDHSDSEKGNPLPPHGLLFPISSKGSFICTIS